jgi:hypothetical protein
MDDQLLKRMYHYLFDDPTRFAAANCTYSDGVILLIFFKAVLGNISTRQARDKRNWPIWCRRLKFPSYSQLRRRLNSPALNARIEEINREFRLKLPNSPEKAVDGKPLVVGGFSKDADAKAGCIPDGWGRGYKLHALVDACGAVDVFEVTALNGGEPTVAVQLVLKMDLKGALVRGDAGYDSNRLYETAAQQGGRLLAPRKKPGTSLGHHKQHADRLRAIAELEGEQKAGELAGHKLHRNRVEQTFAHLTSGPVGLFALPNFVRRLHRVRQWVAAKILLFHIYLSERNSLRVAA